MVLDFIEPLLPLLGEHMSYYSKNLNILYIMPENFHWESNTITVLSFFDCEYPKLVLISWIPPVLSCKSKMRDDSHALRKASKLHSSPILGVILTIQPTTSPKDMKLPQGFLFQSFLVQYNSSNWSIHPCLSSLIKLLRHYLIHWS